MLFCRKLFLSASTVLFATLCLADEVSTKTYRFGLMPKSLDNPFFFPVREGCEARAAYYGNVECKWIGAQDQDGTGQLQIEIIEDIIQQRLNQSQGALDGLAISVTNGTALNNVIQRAINTGMSIITFDSDTVGSERQAYVGTDNFKFGQQLSEVLLQLRPQGGKMALLTFNSPNLETRVQGIRNALEDTAWTEIRDSPLVPEGGLERAFEQMAELKDTYPDLEAIIPTFGGIMRNESMWSRFVDQHRDMTFVVADASDGQKRLLERGFVHGLVGQLPYLTGEQCIDILLDLQLRGNPPRNNNTNDVLNGTSLSLFLRIPIVLPDLTVDQNYIDNLRVMGYTFFGVVITFDLLLIVWVFLNRKSRVVSASQPIFLAIIAAGVLIMSCSIIPMSMDDQNHSQRAVDISCNAVIWLVSIGFVLVFSALFSKLWRVDRLVTASAHFSRVRVTANNVLPPLIILLISNLVILICWVAIDPLVYERKKHAGTDPWNRVISTYGTCTSSSGDSAIPYLASLGVVNFVALCIANVQAYRTRKVRSELSESKGIAAVVAVMIEALIVGFPVLLLVRDEPRASYVVQVLLVAITCLAVLGFIFVPKVISQRKYERDGLQHRVTVSYGSSFEPTSRPSTSFAVSSERQGQARSSNGAENPSVTSIAAIREAAAHSSGASRSPSALVASSEMKGQVSSNNGAENLSVVNSVDDEVEGPEKLPSEERG